MMAIIALGAQRVVDKGMGDKKGYDDRSRASQRPINLASSKRWCAPPDFH